MKTCLLCHEPVKLIKFKSKDGFVCKHCYEKVSLNFSQTIKIKTKEELLMIYQGQNKLESAEVFEISRKINQLILFDDRNKQICLPNHRKYCQENLSPEYYSFTAIDNFKIEEEQLVKVEKNKSKNLGTIKLVIQFYEKSITRHIWLIPKPIQVDSMLYRTMQGLAKKIIRELNAIKGGIPAC